MMDKLINNHGGLHNRLTKSLFLHPFNRYETEMLLQGGGTFRCDWKDINNALFRIGRKFDGVVSSVTSWGMYVTLENTVEGLVHIASLDDYYDYDRERNQLVGIASRNVFSLGDRVRIRVDSVDIDRAEINFTLVPYR